MTNGARRLVYEVFSISGCTEALSGPLREE